MSVVLTSWIWEETNYKALEQGPYWRMPDGTLGGVDRRPYDAQARRGGPPEGFALVSLDPAADIPSRSLKLADSLDERMSATTQIDMAARLGVAADDLDTATALDAIWREHTELADPTGKIREKPLVPGPDGYIELHLGGLARREKFVWGVHPATAVIKSLIELDFAELKAADIANGKDHYKRVLDAYATKYKVDSKEIIPGQDTLPAATTITDNFNRANETPLNGVDYTATDDTFNVNLSSNACVDAGTSNATAVQLNALAGNDGYCEIVMSAIGSVIAGALFRHAASPTMSCYSAFFRVIGGQWEIWKRTGGTDAQLGGDLSSAGATAGDNVRIEAVGTTIKVYKNSSSQQGGNTTDATFSTGNIAFRMFGSGGWILDDLEGADIGAASITVLRRRWDGY